MEIKPAVKALSALAQESRLEVFRLLVRAVPEGLAAGRIAEDLGIVPATMSFHLSQLANAGLVVDRREGRSIIYSIDVEAMRSLLSFLTEDCCQGRPELCAPEKACIQVTRKREKAPRAGRRRKQKA